jgi:hypothetical protein
MEGSVLSFLKAEWKVSDTCSAHWASSLLKNKSYNEKYYSITINFLNNILDKCICWYNLYHVLLDVYEKKLNLIIILQKKFLILIIILQNWVCKFEKPKTEPNTLSPSTTVLSPYLKFGCVSARTFYYKLQEIYKKNKVVNYIVNIC